MDSGPEAPAAEKRAALLVATLASFITPFMGSSINIALPSIGEEFSIDAIVVGWVATSYLLAAAMVLVPFGKIADILGRKKIFIWGILIYTVSSLLCGLSGTASLLIVCRIIQGIGSAMIFTTSLAILTSVYPANERGRVFGIVVAAVYLGLSLGPFLGGIMTERLGWRSLFYANVPLGIIIILLTLLQLKGEWAEAKGEKFDLTGSIIYSLSLAAIIYGFTLLPGLAGAVLITAGVSGMIGFVYWELKVEHPVLTISLFRENTVFAFSNLAALINYSATFAVTFLLSLYLQYIKELSPEQAGTIMVAQPVVMAIFSPFAGRLSDRVDPRIVASIGMATAVVGLALLIFLTETTSTGYIITSLIILGFGFALFSSPNTNAIMGSVERKSYGVAAATLSTMRLVGQNLSMGIAMLIFALFIGKVQITPEYYEEFLVGIRVAFIIFSVLCFGGVFASLARGKKKP